MFLWVLAIILLLAAFSYAMDVQLLPRLIERLDRHKYGRDGHEVIDQWWTDQGVYTLHLWVGDVYINEEKIANKYMIGDRTEVARYAHMWVDAQEMQHAGEMAAS